MRLITASAVVFDDAIACAYLMQLLVHPRTRERFDSDDVIAGVGYLERAVPANIHLSGPCVLCFEPPNVVLDRKYGPRDLDFSSHLAY
jgi:hypothetical protein